MEKFPTLRSGVVMVQSEVADRLVATPGSKNYGSPSVKATWWADMSPAGTVGRSIFWPVPKCRFFIGAFCTDINLRGMNHFD
jgi:16S rRNA (adenine1518-N6/adenine1519-N6)-dimethyltransferase